ncbi:MAG: polysaccharide deacetylase family protein [Pseudomonadota bacterium]|nr:polysaccharide deacetylase family protein [Pseudomonadota bacterium]
MKLPWPLAILVYHRVPAQPDPLFPERLDARRFERQLRLLERSFHLLPLGAALRRLAERRLPPRAACLTFDDGYAEHAAVVLPILQRHRAPAAFFVASGLLDGGCLWHDAVTEAVRSAPGERLNLGRAGFGVHAIGSAQQRRAVIDMLIVALAALPAGERGERVRRIARRANSTMLSTDQLLALHRAGMEIGAQTVSQPVLSALSNVQARAEIAGCRAALQDITQAAVSLFAYPHGEPGRHFEARHVDMLRAQGFAAALTRTTGAARAGSDPFYLPRVTPADCGNGRLLARITWHMLIAPT